MTHQLGPSAAVEVVPGPLGAEDAAAVLELLHAATAADGVEPVSEQPRLWLCDPHAPVRHLLVRGAPDTAAPRALRGYAQVDLGAPDVASAELAVAPDARRRGLGAALLDAAEQAADGRSLRVWAHGDLPAAQSFAAGLGMTKARELLRMERALDAAPPRASLALPRGTSVRPFVVGQDEAAWLALNATAFAHHPEQGRLTLEDLRAREREDWFDPQTFWLAWRGQELVGAVWAKVTDDVGELYVVAVHPAAQGHGLGGALTDLALNRLAARGLARAELYTDADNAAATRTYARAGFDVVARDTQYEVLQGNDARPQHARSLGVETTDVPGMVPPCLL